MKKLFLIISLLIICMSNISCATLKSTGTITKTSNGVEFVTDRPAKMTMEKEGETYTYDSQTPSLLSRIMSAVTLGVVGTRR